MLTKRVGKDTTLDIPLFFGRFSLVTRIFEMKATIFRFKCFNSSIINLSTCTAPACFIVVNILSIVFAGFVGLFSALLFWPVFFALHYSGLEKFTLPHDSQTWLYIIVNGLLGTVLAELLWLW